MDYTPLHIHQFDPSIGIASGKFFFYKIKSKVLFCVQQGDPCGPALFCLGIHDLLLTLESELSTWYLDDGVLGGDLDSISRDLTRIQEFAHRSGLELNTAKCECYVFGSDSDSLSTATQEIADRLPGLCFRTPADLDLLGAPVFPEALSSYLEKKRMLATTWCTRLLYLASHPALFLLRASLSTPRLLHLLRCVQTNTHISALREIDALFTNCLSSILNIHLSPTALLQATLPIRLGGLGLRRLEDLSLPTYLSSLLSST